jgi:phage FluMu gp28-like protein
MTTAPAADQALRPDTPAGTYVGDVSAEQLDQLGSNVPAGDHDPLADGILMHHQREWVEDQSTFKLAEKGRRTGFTYAEALDSTMIAMTARNAGGDNTFYIGDTKSKGLEFIATCAHFARVVAAEVLTIGVYVWDDVQDDGSSKQITSYRIRFASGFKIEALSSNPANIRGLQGRVIIDEAAFHSAVKEVLKAVNALVIWGGVVRVISTHNGHANPFNDLIKDTRAGKTKFRIHHATFDDAVANGLYERVCLVKGWTVTAEGKQAWYDDVRGSYGTDEAAMKEELDAVPKEGEGQLIPLAHIEACSTPEFKVIQWAPKVAGFVDLSDPVREATIQEWLDREVAPVLEKLLDPDAPTAIGEDFGMRQDRTDIAIGQTSRNLLREVKVVLEMRQCPYPQQRQILFWLGERLPKFQGGILDANGNGMALAQEARIKYGPELIVELMANDNYYRERMPGFAAAFSDQTIMIPAHRDVRDDIRQIMVINGVPKVPRNVRTEGTDGGKRHADSAVAIFNLFCALDRDVIHYGYQAAPCDRAASPSRDDRDRPATGHFARGAW